MSGMSSDYDAILQDLGLSISGDEEEIYATVTTTSRATTTNGNSSEYSRPYSSGSGYRDEIHYYYPRNSYGEEYTVDPPRRSA